MSTKSKQSPNAIAALRDGIASCVIGREREAEIIAIAMIAREHALLVGPPGTAKSQISRAASQLVDGARYFERLLSPTTAPESIWGPISLSALKQDRYEHITAGYAADAHVLFLDEVGRMSPAIGDSMLHLLGPERQALIGTKQIKAPLVAAIGSANTWPEDAAMLDRWTIRTTVQPLGAGMRRALLTFQAPTLSPVMTLADLDAAHAAARALPISDAAFDTYDAIMAALDESGIKVSDRRLRSSQSIARAACVLRGGSEVAPIDLEVLQYVLWTTPDQAATAGAKIVALANPLGARLDAILGEADEIVRAAIDKSTQLAAVTKLDQLVAETTKLAADPSANGRAARTLAYVKREHARMHGVMLGLPTDKIEAMLAGLAK
jgi:MoxR-like ATPase